MIKNSVRLSLICLLISSTAFAQTEILKKSIQKINASVNLSYTQVDRQQNPFTEEWTTLKLKVTVMPNPANNEAELYDVVESRGYRSVNNGTVRTDLDLNNKTYRLKNGAEKLSYLSPYHWARFMQKKINTSAEKMRLMPDTVINNTKCFYIKIIMADSATNRQVYDLCLSKTTYLPVFVREFMRGTFGKGDMTGGVATMINELSYNDYRINSKSFPAIKAFTIPGGFNAEQKVAVLKAGTKAPAWELKDLKGNSWSAAKLKGKVTVIDFSFNECAACMLSIPVLNTLHEKYKDSNVEIITVNTSNTKASVAAFVKKNNITFPVMINGNKVSNSFQVSAFPTFYIIDKEGNIVNSIAGVNKELEKDLIAQIDKIK